MDWRPYNSCCAKNAADPEAVFCAECRHLLLRCQAFADCGGLVSPGGPCPHCVAPRLSLDAGATTQSKKGDRLAIPLVLRNASTSGRALWVKRIEQRESDSPELVALTFDAVEAGGERRFPIETAPLDESGSRTIRVVLVVATRHRNLEEEYAFKADLTVAISGTEAQSVTNNITVSGTGHLFHKSFDSGKGEGAATAADTAIPLERAERYEIEQGIRGYASSGWRVPRQVPFTFKGFRDADHPGREATMAGQGRLSFGRNRRGPAPESGMIANDVCLRAFARSGEVDEPATLAISRHHFDLVIANERLCLHAAASKGVQVAGRLVPAGQLVPLASGDDIVPIPDHPEKLALRVTFTHAFDTVEHVTITRTPAVPA